jgi:hypothetical protein
LLLVPLPGGRFRWPAAFAILSLVSVVASGCSTAAARPHPQTDVHPSSVHQTTSRSDRARVAKRVGHINQANKCSLTAPAVTLELDHAYSCWAWASGGHPRVTHDFLLGRTRTGRPELSDSGGHWTRLPARGIKPHFDRVTRSCVVLAYGRTTTVKYSIAHHRLLRHC